MCSGRDLHGGRRFADGRRAAPGRSRRSATSTVFVKTRQQALGMIDAFTQDADFSASTARAISACRRCSTKRGSRSTRTAPKRPRRPPSAAHDLGVIRQPPPKPTIVHVDHPFLIVVRDRTTGATLFFGRVTDPTISERGVCGIGDRDTAVEPVVPVEGDSGARVGNAGPARSLPSVCRVNGFTAPAVPLQHDLFGLRVEVNEPPRSIRDLLS